MNVTCTVVGMLVACLVIVHADKPFPDQDLCAFICRTAKGCPKSCKEYFSAWNKRSLDHRFDDYSFDDYLFMKLMGRNLQG